MKKLGGVLLILLGVALILVAITRTVNVALVFSAIGSASAYNIGALTGTAIVIILFIALGVKSFKKGVSLLKPSVTAERTAGTTSVQQE